MASKNTQQNEISQIIRASKEVQKKTEDLQLRLSKEKESEEIGEDLDYSDEFD